jgi:hypothetical protein
MQGAGIMLSGVVPHGCAEYGMRTRARFLSSSVLLSSLEFSDTHVYAPQVRESTVHRQAR